MGTTELDDSSGVHHDGDTLRNLKTRTVSQNLTAQVTEAHFVGEIVIQCRNVAIGTTVADDANNVARLGLCQCGTDVGERLCQRTIRSRAAGSFVHNQCIGRRLRAEPEIELSTSRTVRISIERCDSGNRASRRVIEVVGVDDRRIRLASQVQT